MKKLFKIIFIIFLIFFIFSIIFLFLFNFIFSAYNPKKEKRVKMVNEISKEEQEWFYNENIKKLVEINSYDNYSLYGNLYENEKEKPWIIIVHGYYSSGFKMSPIGKKYYDEGYNVLIIEQRAHSISEGKYITFGYKEKYDLNSWINYINETYKKDNPKIILHGLSMGASTVLETLGNTENLPDNIICAIEDCGYSSLPKELLHFVQKVIKNETIEDFLLFIINIMTKLILNFSIYDVIPMESTQNIDIPVLFIHGKKDDFVPFDMVYENYKNAKDEKELLIFEEGTHARCYLADKDLYWNGIWNFFEKYKK